MGNRCYVAKIDIEKKEIELFYNHWNGGFSSIVPMLEIAKQLKLDFNGFAKLNEKAYNEGTVLNEVIKIDENFSVAKFIDKYDCYDNRIYFIDKDLNLRARYFKNLVYCHEDLEYEFSETADYVIEKADLKIKSSDIKYDKYIFTDLKYIDKHISLQEFLELFKPSDDKNINTLKVLNKSIEYLNIGLHNEDFEAIKVVEKILSDLVDDLGAKNE
ncbi:hypothetical protein AVBRAN9333_08520 [Campylobacter sp. RM9333]|uniref:hypothetical protein n=1 Tax=Campylobacter sp. RM9333 TaxID=2735731 RepID=UPI001D8C5B57|nr:hypothetical protein [Campylobacter sp. RM9333]